MGPASSVPAAGYFHPGDAAHAVVCGSAACQWLRAHATRSSATLAHLFTHGARHLILARGTAPDATLAAAATAFPGAVWSSADPESSLVRRLRERALDRLPAVAMSGTMLQVHGLGVLLRGPSGSGKSSTALELVARGHRLVADDLVELRRLAPDLVLASAAARFRGFIAVAELGILDIRRLYGARATVSRTRVDLVLTLAPPDSAPATAEQRIHGRRTTQTLLGVPLAGLQLGTPPGRNLATWVESACRDHLARLAGYRADEAFLALHHHALAAGSDIQPPCN